MQNQNRYPNMNEPYGGYGQPNPYGNLQSPTGNTQSPYNNFQFPVTNQNSNNQQPNTSMNAATMNIRHGAQQRLHEGQYYNKDLDKTLQGSARAGFVRKVYTLLTLQLLVTMGIGYFGYNSEWFKAHFINLPLLIILSVLLIVISCVIGCCVQTFRKYALPIFIIFTIIFALLIAISICAYKSMVVLMAAGITFVLVAALTAYACITKTDLTGCGPYLCVLCLVLLIFGIVCIFVRNPIVQTVYSSLSALLFAFYLIFDTQLVLGRGQYSYTLDDAYLASIQLYIDVMQLFLHILNILGQNS